MHEITTLDTDAVIVGFHEDVRPLKGAAGSLDWLLCGTLSRLIVQKKMLGKLGEVALLTSQGKMPAKKVFLLGLGPRAQSSPETLRSAARAAASSLVGAGVSRAAMDCFPQGGPQDDESLAAVRRGVDEGAGEHVLAVTLLVPDAADFGRTSLQDPA